MCPLQETHLKHKDTESLKVNRMEKCIANVNSISITKEQTFREEILIKKMKELEETTGHSTISFGDISIPFSAMKRNTDKK